MNRLRFEVQAHEKGIRLFDFLKNQEIDGHSFKSLKRIIDSKGCRVNGRAESFSSKVLFHGDVVEFDLFIKETKKNPQLPILWEDEDFLICNKEAGIVSETASFNQLLPSYHGILQLIHRLDKDTSGLVLVAKNESIRKKFVDLFFKRSIEKTYLAIVNGQVRSQGGCIENYLAKKFGLSGQAMFGSVAKSKGRFAKTRWSRLRKGKGTSLLECRPETGRTHQLRVHLSEMGHPILGDYQYGPEEVNFWRPERQMLHAHEINFCHPVTQKKVHAKADMPSDFKKILDSELF